MRIQNAMECDVGQKESENFGNRFFVMLVLVDETAKQHIISQTVVGCELKERLPACTSRSLPHLTDLTWLERASDTITFWRSHRLSVVGQIQ